MFSFLGNLVSRGWPVVLAAWIALIVGSKLAAPSWEEVAQDKVFAFLPADAPSRLSEDLFRKAFPDEHLGSNVVLVLENSSDEPGHLTRDKKFVEDVIEPGLRRIAQSEGGLASEAPPSDEPLFANEKNEPKASAPSAPRSIVARIRTPNAPGAGALLVSPDGKALLVVVELTTELISKGNWPVINKIEEFVHSLSEEGKLPPGDTVYLTGSAILGRDHTQAQLQSARATELWTVLLVIGLLVMIYRAPLLAAIPLATVFLAVQVSINLLAVLAGAGYISLFEGIQIYITVLGYGAGVDYCLFLMARYKEELDHGMAPKEAAAHAIGQVGAALTASAATVMFGIGMMSFAQFGKFREAGFAVPFSLGVALLASLTFTTALLRLCGKWAFWPFIPQDGKPVARRVFMRFFQPGLFYHGWKKMGQALLLRPGRIWLTTAAAMLPFAVAAVLLSKQLSYDLIGSLPSHATSVVGTKALQQHFPAGIIGPVTILLSNPNVDFGSDRGQALVTQLSDRLAAHKEELGVTDIRSVSAPLGITPAAKEALTDLKVSKETREEAERQAAVGHYTTSFGERTKTGTRLDLILAQSPFSRDSIDALDRIEHALPALLPSGLEQGTQVYYIGPTASVREFRTVMDRDHTTISVLVLVSVFVILVALLRKPLVSAYLVLSVLFSYYATLGVTFAVFWAIDPSGFSGIDWKVATFLFTILIAVGEDYNIFLMARIEEERRRRDPLHAITEALARTGPIISSCGVIMAGTFASLMAGSLTEMKQLGFALAFGVLLDTFVVRPILVPAFLVLLQGFRLTRTNGPRQEEKTEESEVAAS